ncbi:hypothetical protein HD599_001240 [Conyzicola lurida]|uniref:Uncharacterized protein n=1 Tax=Conyzicola lurida TaxID=1172621 RepID=A0A841AI53_9MICO|nr:hypothetical protein [Conyzicola lurida]MBB5842917.1 hypothetical protein [Conyzicola lurida]
MSDSTYTAHLIGDDGTETVELDLIQGLPQKSFVRAGSGDFEGEEVVWELVEDGEDEGLHEYREAGRPGADYA